MPSEVAAGKDMERFIYESKAFGDELERSPHVAGEVNFLRSIARPAMYVIEAGANRGVTAVALAKAIGEPGHLYAFEPVPEYYAELKENLSRNAVHNASAYRLALSNRARPIQFYKHGGGTGITPAEDADMLWVEATTIADFVAEHKIDRVDLLNLDCEGSELLVFQGAKAILEEQGPQIFCEIHHAYLKELGQSAHDVISFLTGLGYNVWPLHVEDLNAETNAAECSHIYARRPSRERDIEDLKKNTTDLRARSGPDR